MTTTTAKKANRGHLLRAAKKGQLFVKCNFHLTDDYAFDAANDGGRMDAFKRVYLREEHSSPLEDKVNEMYANGATHAEVEPVMEELRREREAFDDEQRQKATGMVMMRAWELRSKSGHVHGDTERGNFSVHSNLNYEYEIRK